MDKEPPLQPGADKRALKLWQQKGPYKLSDMCLHAMVPIDFENGKYRIECKALSEMNYRVQQIVEIGQQGSGMVPDATRQ